MLSPSLLVALLLVLLLLILLHPSVASSAVHTHNTLSTPLSNISHHHLRHVTTTTPPRSLTTTTVTATENNTSSNVEIDSSDYCSRPWPTLELILPLGLIRKDKVKPHEWKNIFLPSFLLFCPVQKSNISISIIIDEEQENTTLLEDRLLKPLEEIRSFYERHTERKTHFPRITIQFHHHPNPTAWNRTNNRVNYNKLPYKSGYGRQQYLAFVADQFTDAEYIGMVDDDSLFSTFIDREDIFLGDKPIIRGRLQIMTKSSYPFIDWMMSAYTILGKETPMDCMSYFPVVVKRKHLQELRDYVAQYHKAESFDVVFENVFPHDGNPSERRYSQFCVICSYLYWFKYEEYAWYFQDLNPLWNGVSNPKPVKGYFSTKSNFTKDSLRLRPFIASHASYREPTRQDVVYNNKGMQAVLLQGLCSNPHQKSSDYDKWLNCTEYTAHHAYNDELYGFERVQYDTITKNSTDLLVLYDERMARFAGCDLSYGRHEFYRLFNNLNYTKVDYKRLLNMKLKH